MFLNLAQVATTVVKVMIPEEGTAQGLARDLSNVEVVVDSRVAKDQFNLSVDGISVQGLDKE